VRKKVLARIIGENIVKIGERYTIVIPKEIRRKLGIKKGQLMRITSDRRRIILEPISENPFEIFERNLGDFVYSRKMRKEAEKELLEEASRHADLKRRSPFSSK